MTASFIYIDISSIAMRATFLYIRNDAVIGIEVTLI
jgi:hypothetical protein